MQTFLASLVLCSTLLFADAGPHKATPPPSKAIGEPSDITGYYTVVGEHENGKKYSGIAAVSRRNEVYLVQWITGSAVTGIGIRTGDTFAVAWSFQTDKGAVRGVTLYRVSGRTLIGRWAGAPGPGIIASETMTFLKEMPEQEEE